MPLHISVEPPAGSPLKILNPIDDISEYLLSWRYAFTLSKEWAHTESQQSIKICMKKTEKICRKLDNNHNTSHICIRIETSLYYIYEHEFKNQDLCIICIKINDLHIRELSYQAHSLNHSDHKLTYDMDMVEHNSIRDPFKAHWRVS